ncbi:hypothetical protein ACJMK2_030327, partial [Sinanodonta woodiana]
DSNVDNLLDGPVLGRFCGESLEEIPKLLISVYNIITIVFFSDASKTDKGFQGEFEFISADPYSIGVHDSSHECGYTISSKGILRPGYIMSPTYPGVYPDNFRCYYLLQGESSERIKLVFDHFSLFHGGDYCPFDYVEVRDGCKPQSQSIGTFCGQYENVTLYSSTNCLYIEFVTRSGRVSFDTNSYTNMADFAFERTGFNISYTFSSSFVSLDFIQKEQYQEHILGTECDVRIGSRGRSNGTFESPGYRTTFPLERTCRFFLDGRMSSTELEKIKVTFHDFEIPGTMPNCSAGYLSVNLRGHRDPFHEDEKFCGKLWPPDLTSIDPRMILTFDTHGASRGRGFFAYYSFLPDFAISGGKPIIEGQCQFLFDSKERKSGTFNSPRYPNHYPQNSQCVYIFRPDQRERLLIAFDTFSLWNESHRIDPMCLKTDSLEIYDEGDKPGDYYSIKTYCGVAFPGAILTKKGMKAIFRSYSDTQNLGFKARYEYIPESSKDKLTPGCSQHIRSTGAGGVIKSPQYPNKYRHYTYCEWDIEASKRDNKILIQIDVFKLEGDMVPKDPKKSFEGTGCQNAVLRIYDDLDKSLLAPDELCGELYHTAYLSTDNIMKIRFLTSSRALGGRGFQLSWTEVHSAGTCYGFKCQTSGYCISSDLRCNGLPNCGFGTKIDDSDEICPKQAGAQILHIAIGTSISVFFCVVLLICGVYHRRKFRTRDRRSPDHDHVEVRYVAANTSGSNTTERLLSVDQKLDHTDQILPQPSSDEVDNRSNHHSQEHVDNKHPRPVRTPRVQKVSIV